MKIALLGSGFIKPEILQEEINKKVPGCEFTTTRLPWPGKPRDNDDEIQEYAGTFDQVIETAKDAEILVTDLAPVNKYVLDNLKSLKFIGVTRGGPVNINVKSATEHHVLVVNAPGRNGPAVAEFTVGLLLNLIRRVGAGEKSLRSGQWQSNLYNYETAGIELEGHTVGLVGFGQVGKRVAKLLKAFNMEVLVYDPFVDSSVCKSLGVTSVSLEKLLKEADILSIHARLTPQTKGMIGQRELDMLKKGAFVINTARAPLMDYDALYHQLANGFLAGAAIDVYHTEPPKLDNLLFNLPNVLAVPHIGGATQESAKRGAAMIAEDISRYFVEHVDPLHCKNKELLENSRL